MTPTTTHELARDARASFAAPLGSASFSRASVLNADCMEVMSKLADKSYDLAICDPPYDIGEWHDEHPMNMTDKADAEYQRLFAPNDPSSATGDAQAGSRAAPCSAAVEAASKVPEDDLEEALVWTESFLATVRRRLAERQNDKLRHGGE